MAIEFVEQHWITVESKRGTARLCVREPNALEGARYVGAIGRFRALAGPRPGSTLQDAGQPQGARSASTPRSSATTLPSAPVNTRSAVVF